MFMRLMKNNRENGDLMKWITRCQIDGRRLEDSWMDLCPELDVKSPPVQAEVVARRNAHNNAQAALRAAGDTRVIQLWMDEMQQAVYDEAIRTHRRQHRDFLVPVPGMRNLKNQAPSSALHSLSS